MEVTYVDHMGDDIRVVNSARVSFAKESDWEYCAGFEGQYCDDRCKIHGTKCPDLNERDQKLINYLARHNHWTPFSHVQITMREKVPIFVARQRFKHMVGFTYNEVSRRYVDDPPEFFIPKTWRKRAENKKQGSSDETVTHFGRAYIWDYNQGFNPDDPIDKAYEFFLSHAKFLYTELIESGVAPEQARMVLPQNMYTEYYVTGSLAAWARAYKLRSDPNSQQEIQELAEKWNDVISNIKSLQYSWKALTNGV